MELNQEQFDQLVQNCCLAADGVAIDTRASGATNAQVTRAVVRRSLEFLIGNGLVEVVKTGEGEWMALDPPYAKEVVTA